MAGTRKRTVAADDTAPDADDLGGAEFIGGTIDPAAAINGSGGGDTGPGSDDRTFDPERHIGADRINADGTFRRKRGLGGDRAGSGSGGGRRGRKTRQKGTLDLGVVEGVLMSLHAAAAGVLRAPEIALDPIEGESLAKAVVALEEAFPTEIDPRAFAVVNFVGVAAMIYGPKILQMRRRLAEQEGQRQEKANGGLMAPDGGFSMDAFGGQKPN